jgi:hypothetical protein
MISRNAADVNKEKPWVANEQLRVFLLTKGLD